MIFLNSASSAAALVFYLPGVCTHTDTKGKQRKARLRNILKSLEKTQYLMNILYHQLEIIDKARLTKRNEQDLTNLQNLNRFKTGVVLVFISRERAKIS